MNSLLGDIIFTVATLYVYHKILDTGKRSKPLVIIALCFAVALNIFISLPLALPLLRERLYHDIIVLAFVMFTSKGKVLLKLSAFVISTGIVFGVNALNPLPVVVLSSFPQMGLSSHLLRVLFMPFLGGSIFAILQPLILIAFLIVLHQLLKVGRLKAGFLSWENKEIIKVGLLFGMAVLVIREIIVFILANQLGEEYYYIHPIVFHRLLLLSSALAYVCIIGIFSWWRYHTVKQVKERSICQDIEKQIKSIQENEHLINTLKERNHILAEHVHRDNKLIPATYLAVCGFVRSTGERESQEGNIRSLKELENNMSMRKEMIFQVRQDNNPLPTTGLERIDNILSYMFSKANEQSIGFEFKCTEGFKEIITSSVSKEHLSTLLADLIENALIAVSKRQDSTIDRRVKVSMDAVDGCLEIDIQDNGIPFKGETLTKLGQERATTHQNEGGSGIGYLTIFKILKENKGSLIITEYPKENQPFTKSVCIRFDGRAKFVINCLEVQEDISITEHWVPVR